MYVVICFTDTDEVDVAPYDWLDTCNNPTICHWPNLKTTSKLIKAKLSHERPEKDWKGYPVTIMYGPTGTALFPLVIFFNSCCLWITSILALCRVCTAIVGVFIGFLLLLYGAH